MELNKEKLIWLVGGAVIALAIVGIVGVLMITPAAELSPTQPPGDVAAQAPADIQPASDPVAAAPAANVEAAPAAAATAQPAATTEFQLAANELSQIRHKLKQIGLAFHNFHDSRKTFTPRGRNNTVPQLSWRVFLLPYLDQMPLYRRFKLDEPWDSPHNLELIQYMPEIYRSGNDDGETTRFVVLTGDDAFFRTDRPVNIRQCVDGTSNTILLMHSGGATGVPWTKPDDVPFDPQNPLQGVAPLGENYELMMVDGAVLSLPAIAGPEIFAALVTPRGGEVVDTGGLRRGRVPTITARKPLPPLPEYRQPQQRRERVDPRRAKEEAVRAMLASVPQAPVTPDEYSFEHPSFTFAYDQTSGRLIALEQEQNQVTFYDFDGGMKSIGSLPAPARPISVTAKRFGDRSYFVVGGKLDSRIDVFDAKDASPAGTVVLQVPMVVDLESSLAPDDPYVYYSLRDNDANRSLIGRLDVDDLSDDGFLGSYVSDFATSADGTMLYTRGAGSPAGLSAMRVVPRDPQSRDDQNYKQSEMALEGIHSENRDSGPCVADPQGALVTNGKELYSATLAERFGEFEFPVMAFLPRTPWVLGVTEGRLYVGSVNDRRTVLAVQLPADFVPPPPEDLGTATHGEWVLARTVQPIQVFADADRGRIVVTTKDRAAVIDVKSLNLPDEPLLTMGLEGPKSFTIGKPAEFRVKSYDDRVTSRLVAAPVGMELQGEAIAWTPSDVDIGDASLIVERRFDRFRFEQTFALPVQREFVRLPMPARYVSLSPDGKLAVVWNQPRNSDVAPTGENLALVETATGKVLAVQAIEKRFRTARVDDTGVYLLVMPANVAGNATPAEVMRLNLDLSLAESIDVQLRTNDWSKELELVANRFLLAGLDRYSTPEMERLPPDFPESADSFSGGLRVAYPLGGGWMYGGVVWQGDLATAELLCRPSGFRGLSTDVRATELTPWGRTVAYNVVQTTPEKSLIQLDPYAGPVLVSNAAPVALGLNYSATVNRRTAIVIDAYDLAKGRQAWQIVLLRSPNPSSGYSNEDRSAVDVLATAGETIAACADGKLFLVTLAEIRPGTLPRPFRFQLAQLPLVIKPGDAQTAEYKLLDGEPPFDVTLTIGNYRLRESAPANVVLKIDARKIAANLFEVLAPPGIMDNDDPRGKVLDYVDSVTPTFQKVTGRNPSGVPLVIPVTVEATDKQLRTARLDHVFFLEIPTARYVDLITNPESKYDNPYRDRTPPKLAEPTAADQRRERRLAELNAELALDYANDLRKAHPHAVMEGALFREQAAKGKQAADKLFAEAVEFARNERLSGLRTWSDRKGHTTQAQMKSLFADEVVLQLPTGKEVTVSIEKLSDADQAYLNESQQETNANEGDHVIARFKLLSAAFGGHLRRKNAYPPAYIVDGKQQPLLSWRVALLPDLGAEDLFELFHFDEPWDSPHNQQLVRFIPDVFLDVGEGPEYVAQGMTPIMALRTSDSVLSGGHPVTRREIKNPFGAVMFAESRGRTPWSAPNDLDEMALRDRPGALRPRNDLAIVGLSNQTVRALPWKMTAEDGARLASRLSQQPPAPPFTDPRAAFPADDPGTPTDDPFHKLPERSHAEIETDRHQRKVLVGNVEENAPVGTVALHLIGNFPPGSTFRIVDGTGRDTFEIEPNERLLKVKDNARLDFERNRMLSLRVEITGPDGRPMPPRDIEVDLQGVDEPLVVGKQDSLEVLENAAKGTVIGKLAVRDPDRSQKFQATITAGNNHGAFEVDTERSRLVVANEGALRKLAGLGPRPLTIEFRDESGAEPVKLTVEVNVARLPESEPEAKPEPAAKGE